MTSVAPPSTPDRTRPDTRALTLTPQVVIAGLLGGIATASGIALTTTSGWLIVRASEMPQILMLLTAIVGVRTFGISRPVFRYWERLRSHDAALRDLADRRSDTYASLVPLTPARLGRRGRADLLTGVVDDLTDVVEASVRVTVPLIGALVAGVLAAALTAMLDPAVGLVLAAMLAVAAGVTWLSYRVECRAQDEVLAARAEVARVSQLAAENADELRAIGGTGTAQAWVAQAHEVLRTGLSRQSRGRAATAAMLLVVTGAATLAAAWIALGSDHSGPVRALLVLVPVATGEALGVLTEATRALARAQASARRMDALLDQEPAVHDRATTATSHREDATAPSLRCAALTAGWLPGRTDVGPTDLTIAPGERVAVTGPNGSGKSTLLAVLARHLDPSGGRYALDDVDVTTVPVAATRARVAVVDDEPHILATTLRANLRLAVPDADDDQLVDALTRAGLRAWYDGLPDGLDTRLGAGGTGVSGGERSRLAIARAVASGRPVVLLDEPVAHLDHPTAEAVLTDLVSNADGRSLVMVTHHGAGLEHMDRVIDSSGEKAMQA